MEEVKKKKFPKLLFLCPSTILSFGVFVSKECIEKDCCLVKMLLLDDVLLDLITFKHNSPEDNEFLNISSLITFLLLLIIIT